MEKKINLLPVFLFFFSCVQGQVLTGELKKWHTVTIEFSDSQSYSETGNPNPFLDRRLNVTFNHAGSGKTYLVPGYFAADGNAAETSATSGNKWHVKFTPDETGLWTYSASYRTGTNVAVIYPSSNTDGIAGAFDGENGSFSIGDSDKSGRDFRSKGRLIYDGTQYPKFAETGEAFIKVGPDSPENLLAYLDFDDVYVWSAPDNRKTFNAHISDWQTGDPQWQGTKGRGLIGAINYLSNVGMNSISFLTMNKNTGDTRDVTMHVDPSAAQEVQDFTQYDISRIAQWDVVFTHAQSKGMFLHFKTQEQENAAQLDNGNLGTERKLYYREIIARFGHHLVLNWNMGEENEGSSVHGFVNTAQRIAQLQYVKDIDPYGHLRVVHSASSNSGQDAMYNPLLGNLSELTGISMQVLFPFNHQRVKYWIDQSRAAGKIWPISSDETGVGGVDDQANREQKLYGTYFAGGYGVEYYFQGEDFTIEDFRSGDKEEIWRKAKFALDFMSMIPVTEMEGDDSLISGGLQNQCFFKNNDTYALYLREGNDNPTLDISGSGDNYTIKWFDPRNGGALQDGSITNFSSTGNPINIGVSPNSGNEDWVVLITNASVVTTPSISINNSIVEEGDDAVLEVVLNNDAPGGFQVTYSTTDGSALAGDDYNAANGTLIFNGTSGERKTIRITTIDDTEPENEEQFNTVLTSTTNGVEIADDTGVVTIQDNEIEAQISVSDIEIIEGQDAVLTLTLDNALAGGVIINYETADISAIAGQDYNSTSGVVNFLGIANEIQTVTIGSLDDSLVEPNEQFVTNFSSSTTNVTIENEQVFITISDNDTGSPSPSVSIGNVTVTEGEIAVFEISLDGEVPGGFTLDFATVDASALENSDYVPNSGFVTFAGTDGETQEVMVQTIDDAVGEDQEQFFIQLSNPSNGDVLIAIGTGTAAITDDDAGSTSPSVSIGNVTVTEGEIAVFEISLDGEVPGGFTLDFATVDGSALENSDYPATNGSLSFDGNNGEIREIMIQTIDDIEMEVQEQFSLQISNPSNAAVTISADTGIATITDNDAPTINISNSTAEEGSVMNVPVSLSASSEETIEFQLAFQDVSTSPTDYDNSPITVVFEAGETERNVPISIFRDNEFEDEETFSIFVEEVIQGTVANPDVSAIGSIVNELDMILFPVPITDSSTPLSLTGVGNGTFTLAIYTTSGATLTSQLVDIVGNTYVVDTLDLLSNGLYILSLQDLDSGREYQKYFAINK